MLQPVQQTLTVTVLAELVAVNATVLFQHVTLECPQQVVRSVVQQFSLGFWAAFACHFTALTCSNRRWDSIPISAVMRLQAQDRFLRERRPLPHKCRIPVQFFSDRLGRLPRMVCSKYGISEPGDAAFSCPGPRAKHGEFLTADGQGKPGACGVSKTCETFR